MLWEIPKAELHQLIHVHHYQDGAICRPLDAVDRFMDQVDAVLARYRLTTHPNHDSRSR